MKRSSLIACALLIATTSCMGVRTDDRGETINAHAFNIFGVTLPQDDYERAWEAVPPGATVISAGATNKDWTSFLGILTSIFGFSSTQITYAK